MLIITDLHDPPPPHVQTLIPPLACRTELSQAGLCHVGLCHVGLSHARLNHAGLRHARLCHVGLRHASLQGVQVPRQLHLL